MTQLKKAFLVRSSTKMPVYYNQPHIKISKITQSMMDRHHTHTLLPHQCGSINTQKINAPLPLVWSMVRQFSNPQAYKQFIKSCTMRVGDGGGIGSVREVKIISGMPAERSTERLDKLDDDMHVMMFSIIGGDHRLKNYQATTTVHEEEVDDDDDDEDEDYCTVVIESYVVDTPSGNSKEDTCSFADTIIGCNLKSLARITEKLDCIV